MRGRGGLGRIYDGIDGGPLNLRSPFIVVVFKFVQALLDGQLLLQFGDQLIKLAPPLVSAPQGLQADRAVLELKVPPD